MYWESAVNGFKKGILTLLRLSKIVVPVYFFVTFLSFTPILGKISDLFEPVMKVFGLPGQASLPLILGNFVNLYAGLSAMLSLSLTPKQATILAIMLSFSHSLFLETAVVKKVGVSSLVAIFVRGALAVIAGIIFNLLL
ncbi:MAG: nucleoside recognition protein [Tissierellia bacterium]|nr:nucleoside recognition protein [Tissierellia bacterium]